MKLLRYGPKGGEKPGLIDAAGKIRDLSGVIPDLGGETASLASIDRLRGLDPETLPLVGGEGAHCAGLGGAVAGETYKGSRGG